MVTPDFFQTFGGTILRGRGFTDNDKSGAVRVALVSQRFADQYLRDVDPLLQRIELNELADAPTARAAGRVADCRRLPHDQQQPAARGYQ